MTNELYDNLDCPIVDNRTIERVPYGLSALQYAFKIDAF